MTNQQNRWTREELILTLSVYFQLPFGRLNRATPEVRELARLIGRSDNSAALRLVNFAACDPYITESGRTGMPAGKPICQPIWDEFANDKEKLFLEAQRIKANLLHQPIEETLHITSKELEGKEKETVIKQRVNQSAFRSMILYNYEERCAITGINIPELLVASHIVPWSVNEKERLNPENGICLSALYDRAFDQGFISIDMNNKIILADKLRRYKTEDYYAAHFASIKNQPIRLPEEHLPNPVFLEWHRDCVFNKYS